MMKTLTWVAVVLILAFLAAMVITWNIAMISIDIAKWLITLFIILAVILILLGRLRHLL